MPARDVRNLPAVSKYRDYNTKGTWTSRYLGPIIIIVNLCLFALKMIAFTRIGKGGGGDKTGNWLSDGDKVN